MKIGKMFGALLAVLFAMTTLTTTQASAATYRWECRYVPPGHVYSMVRADQGCEPLYWVTLPENGLWSCIVPAGYTYTATRVNSNCRLGGSTTQYQLAKI
ncbi:hypothetical protein GCM10022243_09820 [Saccharothrix violaceirubra]|uniref:Secreted protein n=1 Tax=Saccharothrix violaceirubra TaxID=413306 RepID=A0A7W7WWJ7_9PSEU|nr:hypothetical protein [Saccharothrix violaceirubra]MBB4966181.1 hypothetical protein [Saccharothrix violaceirubra]